MSSLINSINVRYSDRIEYMIKHNIDIESKRLKIIDISEEYFTEVGEQLPSPLIYLLTEWFLADTLKSKDVDKVTKTEYPVLSKYQLKRRSKKQVAVQCDTLDYLNQTRGRQERKVTQNKQEQERA